MEILNFFLKIIISIGENWLNKKTINIPFSSKVGTIIYIIYRPHRHRKKYSDKFARMLKQELSLRKFFIIFVEFFSTFEQIGFHRFPKRLLVANSRVANSRGAFKQIQN